jgi:hypothetical protein
MPSILVRRLTSPNAWAQDEHCYKKEGSCDQSAARHFDPPLNPLSNGLSPATGELDVHSTSIVPPLVGCSGWFAAQV